MTALLPGTASIFQAGIRKQRKVKEEKAEKGQKGKPTDSPLFKSFLGCSAVMNLLTHHSSEPALIPAFATHKFSSFCIGRRGDTWLVHGFVRTLNTA